MTRNPRRRDRSLCFGSRHRHPFHVLPAPLRSPRRQAAARRVAVACAVLALAGFTLGCARSDGEFESYAFTVDAATVSVIRSESGFWARPDACGDDAAWHGPHATEADVMDAAAAAPCWR